MRRGLLVRRAVRAFLAPRAAPSLDSGRVESRRSASIRVDPRRSASIRVDAPTCSGAASPAAAHPRLLGVDTAPGAGTTFRVDLPAVIPAGSPGGGDGGLARP
jgi:hypothetical protein